MYFHRFLDNLSFENNVCFVIIKAVTVNSIHRIIVCKVYIVNGNMVYVCPSLVTSICINFVEAYLIKRANECFHMGLSNKRRHFRKNFCFR